MACWWRSGSTTPACSLHRRARGGHRAGGGRGSSSTPRHCSWRRRAFGGAAYAVAGLYLVLNQITVDQLKDGPIGALNGKPPRSSLWVVMGAIAFVIQYIDTRRVGFETIERSRYRYGG